MDILVQRIKPAQAVGIKHERRRAVGGAAVKLGARPVEHRHEVIGDALYSHLGATAYIFTIIVDEAVGIRSAELYILMYRDRFDNIKHKPVGAARLRNGGQALARPHAARFYVIYRRHDRAHARYLRYVFKAHGVVCPIPTE